MPNYLAGVVRTLHDRDHITLQYVSPMNEPDNSFADCGQEGMQVPVAQRAAVVQALGRALAQRAPYAKVIADETTADAILSTEAPVWLAVPGTARFVAAVAHHTYDFPTDALRKLVPPIATRFGVPTWMTEICCYKGSGGVASSFGAQYDPTMRQGFWLADQIDSDLTVAGDSAWYWWTALSPVLGCDPKADPTCPSRVNTKGFNDGLLYYDQHGPADGVTRIFTTKRFFVLGQFSRYVRPGAVRHAVTGLPESLHAMAFRAGRAVDGRGVERVDLERFLWPRPPGSGARGHRRDPHRPVAEPGAGGSAASHRERGLVGAPAGHVGGHVYVPLKAPAARLRRSV